MFIEVVGASGSKNALSRLVCMKLGEKILLDAGSASFVSADQLDLVDVVLLTHAHLDHILDLGFILDSMVSRRNRPLVVMGSSACLSIVRAHYMNGLLWPDFTGISIGSKPLLEYRVLDDEVWETLPGGVECMAVPVNHPAGARGFLFRHNGFLVVYTGDTGPTGKLWAMALEQGRPGAVVIEISFPDSRRDIALASDHLSPSLARNELDKLGIENIPVHVFHMKPWFTEEIAAELCLPGKQVHFMKPGDLIEFS